MAAAGDATRNMGAEKAEMDARYYSRARRAGQDPGPTGRNNQETPRDWEAPAALRLMNRAATRSRLQGRPPGQGIGVCTEYRLGSFLDPNLERHSWSEYAK